MTALTQINFDKNEIQFIKKINLLWLFDHILDYFSCDDPFTHDIQQEDLIAIGKLFSAGNILLSLRSR